MSVPPVFYPSSFSFLVNPPCLLCRSVFFPYTLSPPSLLALSTSLRLNLAVVSDCPCQLFCWCFLLYFHLTPFCWAYQGLLTAPAVRYLLTVYLLEAFSHRCGGHDQPAWLARLWILWHHPCLLWVLGDPMSKKCLWVASSNHVKSPCLLQTGPCSPLEGEPKPDRQVAFTIRQMSRKARCCVQAQSRGRLVFSDPQGGTHSLTHWSSHSSHVSFMGQNINLQHDQLRHSTVVSQPLPPCAVSVFLRIIMSPVYFDIDKHMCEANYACECLTNQNAHIPKPPLLFE